MPNCLGYLDHSRAGSHL